VRQVGHLQELIYLSQKLVYWTDPANAVMNLRDIYNASNFITSELAVTVSRRIFFPPHIAATYTVATFLHGARVFFNSCMLLLPDCNDQ